MFRVLLFAKNNSFESDDDIEFVRFYNLASLGYCDAVILDSDTIQISEEIDFGFLCGNEDIVKIILLKNNEEESDFFHYNFDAFLRADTVKFINNLMFSLEKKIILVRKINMLKKEIARNNILHESNNVSLDIIKVSTNKATKKIESNFESCIEVLKDVASSAVGEINKNKLTFVLNSLRKYILILQFEDEIFQVIDGIKETNNDRLLSCYRFGLNLSDEEKLDFRKHLASFYTIQNQRDAIIRTSTKHVEDSELTFF